MIKPLGRPGIAIQFSTNTTKKDTYVFKNQQMKTNNPRHIYIYIYISPSICKVGSAETEASTLRSSPQQDGRMPMAGSPGRADGGARLCSIALGPRRRHPILVSFVLVSTRAKGLRKKERKNKKRKTKRKQHIQMPCSFHFGDTR